MAHTDLILTYNIYLCTFIINIQYICTHLLCTGCVETRPWQARWPRWVGRRGWSDFARTSTKGTTVMLFLSLVWYVLTSLVFIYSLCKLSHCRYSLEGIPKIYSFDKPLPGNIIFWMMSKLITSHSIHYPNKWQLICWRSQEILAACLPQSS